MARRRAPGSFFYEAFPAQPTREDHRVRAEEARTKLSRKGGDALSPVPAFSGALAKSFWGKAWCSHLESYSDYSNRLPRGRSYVRGGAVVDLQIERAQVRARVQGTRLYKVEIDVKPVAPARWAALVDACRGDVGSLHDLLAGELSPTTLKAMCAPDAGLFPAPNEIELRCSCPDWASMCKHVAAVLYGIGARFDERPELLFLLRGADHLALVTEAAVATVEAATAAPAGVRLLDDATVHALFGVALDDDAGAATRSVEAAAPAKAAPKRIARSARPAPESVAPAAKPAKTPKQPARAAKSAKPARPAEPTKPAKPPARAAKPAKAPTRGARERVSQRAGSLGGLEQALSDALSAAFAEAPAKRAKRRRG